MVAIAAGSDHSLALTRRPAAEIEANGDARSRRDRGEIGADGEASLEGLGRDAGSRRPESLTLMGWGEGRCLFGGEQDEGEVEGRAHLAASYTSPVRVFEVRPPYH